MSATQAATSAAVGGSECRCRSCSRTEPMSIESAASGAVAPRISSVEPPPMSTTSTGGAGGVAQVAHRAVEGQRRLDVAADHLGLDARAARARRRRRRAAFDASRRRRRRDEPHPLRRHVVRRGSARRTRRSRRTPAPAPRRRSGRCGRGPGRAAPSASRGRRRRAASPISSLIVLVPQSMAATRPRTGPLSTTRRAGRAPRRRAGSRPRPCASDWPASTCRHFTRSGMPPAEMPSISWTLPSSAGRRGSARARSGTPRPARGPPRAGPASPSSGPEPSRVPIRDAARGQVR